MKSGNPENSLVKSIITSSHTVDLIDKVGEVAIDALLTEGVLREIPIIGTAISLYRAGNNIAAHTFAKKIIIFFSEVEKISPDNRIKYFEDIGGNEAENKIGETLLLVLDKLDDYLLAKMLGKAFCLLASGEIHKNTYEMCVHSIKQLNPYLIRQLHGIYQVENVMVFDGSVGVSLSNCGLVDLGFPSPKIGEIHIKSTIEKTKFGEFFYEKFIRET